MPNIYPLNFMQTKTALSHDQINEDNKAVADDKLITVTMIKGKLEFTKLKDTLKLLFNKYLLLRCSLHQDVNSNYYLQEDVCFENITIKYIQSRDLNAWRKIIEERIGVPFQTNKSLWEITLFSSWQDTHYLIFGFHHVITDGIASADFVHKLLAGYADVKTLEQLKERSISLPIENLFKEKFSYKKYLKEQEKIVPPPPAPLAQSLPLTQRCAKNFFIAYVLIGRLENIIKWQNFLDIFLT